MFQLIIHSKKVCYNATKDTHLPKKIRYFLIAVALIAALDVVHTSLLNALFEAKLESLKSYGLNIKTLKEEKHFSHANYVFLVRLDNSGLASQTLLGLDDKHPFRIALSPFEGTTLRVALKQSYYTFSHTLKMVVTLDTLPDHFAENSTFFGSLLAFTKARPNLAHATFNLLTHDYELALSELAQTFNADANVSYHVKSAKIHSSGTLKSFENFQTHTNVPSINLRILDQATPIFELRSKPLKISVERDNEKITYVLNADSIYAAISTPKEENTTLEIEDAYAWHEEESGQFITITSKLSVNALKLNTHLHHFALDSFGYHTSLSHLDKEVIGHIQALIDSSNTNEQLFIFEDISKELRKLLRMQARLDIYTLYFKRLHHENIDYEGAQFSMHVQPKSPVRPFEFESRITISPKIYELFLEHIPNANLTKSFLTRNLDDSVMFHLQTSPEGLRLNTKLLIEPHAQKSN